MSWLSNWFQKDKGKLVLSLGKQILKLFVGSVADKIVDVAKEEVEKAEASGQTGTKKYEQALHGVKDRFSEIREFVLNLAIELCVFALNLAKKKE